MRKSIKLLCEVHFFVFICQEAWRELTVAPFIYLFLMQGNVQSDNG